MKCPKCGSTELAANTWEAWCGDCDAHWTEKEDPEVYAAVRAYELACRQRAAKMMGPS